MRILSLRYFSGFLLLIALLPMGKAVNASQISQKEGTLIVRVTAGDLDNTPANDVYVEAYGFVEKYDSMKSFILKRSHDGQYEASLPHGIYNVFVSESLSVPRCRRFAIRPGLTTYWTLKLEFDDVYLGDSAGAPTKKP